jgi:hypothetical protein
MAATVEDARNALSCSCRQGIRVRQDAQYVMRRRGKMSQGKKMFKKEAVKAATKAIREVCQKDGYSLVKTGSEPEVFHFSRTEDKYICAFSYSFSGRGGDYSIFAHIRIIYRDLSEVMHQLMRNTQYEARYDLSNLGFLGFGGGVGISSNVGRHVKDENYKVLYVSSVDETINVSRYFANVDDFVMAFYEQIKEEEQNFILPAADYNNTIKGFMKKLHYFWTGGLYQFMGHLVAHGLLTSDTEIIQYAFDKMREVMPKVNERARPVDFVETMKTQLAQKHDIKLAWKDHAINKEQQ